MLSWNDALRSPEFSPWLFVAFSFPENEILSFFFVRAIDVSVVPCI